MFFGEDSVSSGWQLPLYLTYLLDMTYQSLSVEIDGGIAWVSFARPDKANALDRQSWVDLKACMDHLDQEPSVRVIVLAGQGKHFCAGIDLGLLMEVNQAHQQADEGRRREALRDTVLWLQAPINAIEACRKPVIAAIHGGCIGAGVDIVCACDLRYGTADSYLQVKEIDMGMVADLGTLQRLPRIVGDGIAREWCFSGRKVSGPEAAAKACYNAAYEDQEALYAAVRQLATTLAAKSPLALRGTKQVMNHAREHAVADSLDYVATWNAGMLLSNDLAAAMQAQLAKTIPEFED